MILKHKEYVTAVFGDVKMVRKSSKRRRRFYQQTDGEDNELDIFKLFNRVWDSLYKLNEKISQEQAHIIFVLVFSLAIERYSIDIQKRESVAHVELWWKRRNVVKEEKSPEGNVAIRYASCVRGIINPMLKIYKELVNEEILVGDNFYGLVDICQRMHVVDVLKLREFYFI